MGRVEALAQARALLDALGNLDDVEARARVLWAASPVVFYLSTGTSLPQYLVQLDELRKLGEKIGAAVALGESPAGPAQTGDGHDEQ